MPATKPARTPDTDAVVGIDIGGTGTRFIATDLSDAHVLARSTVPTPAAGTAGQVLSFLREQILAVTGGRPPAAVGVGASGPVDLTGVIRNPDTLPAFTGLPVLDLLRSITAGPAVIDNDAVCAALAEHHVGAARHAPRSLHITLGTGVGVCLLNDGQPLRHPDGSHPEGGHVAVTLPTARCYCGRLACWEQAASRQTLQHAAARVLNRPPNDQAVIAELAARAADGDAAALATFARYGHGVADGLATLLTLYGPTLVVLGGSAATHLDLYRESILASLSTLSGWIPRHTLHKTELDDYSGALGAAQLATTALHEAPRL